MISIKCESCDKVIEGYNEKHVNYLMSVHKLAKHENE